jgi:hypothetical protein
MPLSNINHKGNSHSTLDTDFISNVNNNPLKIRTAKMFTPDTFIQDLVQDTGISQCTHCYNEIDRDELNNDGDDKKPIVFCNVCGCPNEYNSE